MIAMQVDALKEVVDDTVPVHVISATSHYGLTGLLRELRAAVQSVREAEPKPMVEDAEPDVITLSGEQLSEHWEVEHDESANIYRVFGEKIEKFARRTNYDQFESVNRLRDIMKRMGIAHELSRAGAKGESLVQIGDSQTFPLVEQ